MLHAIILGNCYCSFNLFIMLLSIGNRRAMTWSFPYFLIASPNAVVESIPPLKRTNAFISITSHYLYSPFIGIPDYFMHLYLQPYTIQPMLQHKFYYLHRFYCSKNRAKINMTSICQIVSPNQFQCFQ